MEDAESMITEKSDNKNEPIRILCVFSRLDRGGAESMCMNLYRKIDRCKIQFDFVKHSHDEGFFETEIRSLGGIIYEAPQYKIINHISYCRWWKNHLKNHPEHKMIHGHFFTISAVYFRIAKKLGCVTIAHAHSTSVLCDGILGKIKEFFCRQVEQYADYRIACSSRAGKWLYLHKDFFILNNALDTDKFIYNKIVRDERRESLGVEDCFVVGTVGNIALVKNPYGILEIIKELKLRRQDFRFLWIGGGSTWHEVQDIIKKEKLDDTVILTGARSDVAQLLQAMDVFILPSFSEGLPLTVIEAQAAGLPCFISDVITSEVIITEHCEQLPLKDTALWANAIENAYGFVRRNDAQAVKNAGYDIDTTTAWIQHFYLSVSNTLCKDNKDRRFKEKGELI